MKKGAYNGPVCFVGSDMESADGRMLEGGWHYSMVDDGNGGEMPGEKLFLDHESEKYRYATASDESWQDRHHQQLRVVAPGGYVGEPQTAEEVEACHRHLDDISERLGNLDPHEIDDQHLIRSAKDVMLARHELLAHPQNARQA